MKKISNCIVIVVLVIIVVGIVKNIVMLLIPWLSYNYYEDFASNSKLEKKYSGLGNYEVSLVKYKVNDKNIGKVRIWYPKELESTDETYPMIVVVNASNVKALNLKAAFKRLASWGFIVVGNDDSQSGSGETISKTLDYVLNLDSNSILYDKIDKDNIGITGYSQGGAGAIRAVTEYENSKYYKTIFTGSAAYALLAKNMGWDYDMSKVTIPYFMTASTGVSDDRGIENIETEFGGVAPLSALIDNYDGMTDEVFKIRARVKNAEHGDMLVRTDGYMTAWMLYHLQNDDEAKQAFIGDNGEILTNINYQDIEKNK